MARPRRSPRSLDDGNITVELPAVTVTVDLDELDDLDQPVRFACGSNVHDLGEIDPRRAAPTDLDAILVAYLLDLDVDLD